MMSNVLAADTAAYIVQSYMTPLRSTQSLVQVLVANLLSCIQSTSALQAYVKYFFKASYSMLARVQVNSMPISGSQQALA